MTKDEAADLAAPILARMLARAVGLGCIPDRTLEVGERP